MWKISFNLIFSFSLARSLFVTYQVAKCFKLLLLKSRGFKNIKYGNSSKISHPQIISEFRTVVRFFSHTFKNQLNLQASSLCLSSSKQCKAPWVLLFRVSIHGWCFTEASFCPPPSPGKNAAYWSAMPALCPCEMRACIYNDIIVDPRLPELKKKSVIFNDWKVHNAM